MLGAVIITSLAAVYFSAILSSSHMREVLLTRRGQALAFVDAALWCAAATTSVILS